MPALNENFLPNEYEQSINTVGHVGRMATHRLSTPLPVDQQKRTRLDQERLNAECVSFSAFDAAQRPTGYLGEGWTRTYADQTVLQHLPTSMLNANAPFWVVTADKSVMDGHSDFEKPALFDFVRQVISDYDREIIQYEKLRLDRTGAFHCPGAQ
jgi:hypothetical protein